jgi:hypothetical protein
MNIFVLDTNPIKAAQLQCDKHVVKMVLESAQMLSTAHRVLDGELTKIPSKSGTTMVKPWKLPDSYRDDLLYKPVHVGHPCTIWSMESLANYAWHYEHFQALAIEFEYRYHKTHKSFKLLEDALSIPPKNIPQDVGLTPFRLAMSEYPECQFQDPVVSYRAFYQTKQKRFSMVWSKRDVPSWFHHE